MKIRVSRANMLLPFHGCDPAFIAGVCHAKCCDAPSRPAGMLVTIAPHEQPAIERRGGVVKLGVLQPAAGKRGCPFKQSDHLCGLHGTADKPHGCKSSPFKLTERDTLIVRNRYKLLPCFKTENARPAYLSFFDSLCAAIGYPAAATIRRSMLDGGGDCHIDIPDDLYGLLKGREQTIAGAVV